MFWDVDVWTEMDRLRKEMDSLFNNYGRVSGSTTFPLLNVYDDKENIIVNAELPGMTKDQVSITFSDGVLTISGNKKPLSRVENMAVVRQERVTGSFEKTMRIPAKIEQNKITASFDRGILTVKMPKAEEAKPKTITIEA